MNLNRVVLALKKKTQASCQPASTGLSSQTAAESCDSARPVSFREAPCARLIFPHDDNKATVVH